MTKPRRSLRLFAAAFVVLAAYPAFVLGTVYAQWFRADLPGGRNGPADAYRHSLASATVAYRLTPQRGRVSVHRRSGAGSASPPSQSWWYGMGHGSLLLSLSKAPL